jgi:DNA-binding protein H-NS
MDLSKYTAAELRQLKKDIDSELTTRRKEDARKAQQELKEVAEKYGFSLTDLVAGTPSRSASQSGRAKGPVRFQHPSDASKTWTGRGRKPGWIKEWEADGRSLEDLRVG